MEILTFFFINRDMYTSQSISLTKLWYEPDTNQTVQMSNNWFKVSMCPSWYECMWEVAKHKSLEKCKTLAAQVLRNFPSAPTIIIGQMHVH